MITSPPAPPCSEFSVLLTEPIFYVQPSTAKAPYTEVIKTETATLFITGHSLDLHSDALN